MNCIPKLYLCGTIRNCEKHLPNVFKIITQIVSKAPDYRIIFFMINLRMKPYSFLKELSMTILK